MVETIGRDTTLILKYEVPVEESVETKTFRVIVDASHRIKPGDVVHLDIKPDKLFVFNKETGEHL